jgi:hypothetical protein
MDRGLDIPHLLSYFGLERISITEGLRQGVTQTYAGLMESLFTFSVLV